MIERTYRRLAPYPFVRVRTEIYLGSREPITQPLVYFDGNQLSLIEFTYVPALLTYVREMLDNAFDEVLGRGNGDYVSVDYDPERMVFQVEDNGAGIPIKHDATLGGVPASVLLSEVQAGSNFDESELEQIGYIAKAGSAAGRGSWAGVNGVGGSVVNFTSEWFKLDVWRDKKHFTQIWREGTDALQTDGPIISSSAKADKLNPGHGTRISFKPSVKVFRQMVIPEKLILSHLWMVAAANPGLDLVYNGKKLSVKKTFAATILAGCDPITVDIDHEDFHGSYYLVPNFFQGEEIIYSMVNNVPTFNGGTHIDTFRDAFYPALMDALAARLKKEKLVLRRDDIKAGLLILNVTRMRAPEFDDQSKRRLQSASATRDIKAGFKPEIIQRIIKNNAKWIEQIIERCRDRDNKSIRREQKSTAGDRPAKLKDATSRIRSDCILFLGEGDSAIDSGLMRVRDARIHGGLPLRGKVENAMKMRGKEFLESEAFSDIMKTLGLTMYETADRGSLRYGKCYIAADEDDDGKHITNLLVCYFRKHWPDLFDPKNPYFFKFRTPFIVARKGSTVKYFFSDEYDDYVKQSDKFKGWSITYAKGLGSLTKADWQWALERNRVDPLINDDGGLDETLDLLFNPKRAEDRKEWLSRDPS